MTTLNGGNELIRKKTTKNGKAFLLPPELLLEVFYYLSDCQSALYAASLVCKQWFYCVAPILYSHPQIKDTYHWATLILTLTRERMSFFYGDLIRSIDLSSEHYYHESSNEQEYSMKGLPFIIVSTSSLIQLSRTCKNLTSLNLSYTTLLYDSLIAETGEYLSTLQHYAIQPGLTHIQIPIEEAIQTIGNECHQLTEVKIQRCEWVTAHVIWMFAYYCTNLKRLDARRSTKCTVKRLISHVLEEQPILHHSPPPPHPSSFIVLPASSLSTSTGSNTSHEFEEEEEEDNTHIQINDSMTVHFRFNGNK
ncbi:uncharacterized protein BX663DRAFT_436684 [Cokeromyces recurvatus]|uniref:uncharacterized protein n=1 Tax=Cokeromyces recurvatus TaxID=90255 RepID=UPI00221EE2C4|nr:uncharacterized protein BX663DRAFT_436684 [Cokeromyces recurvatus]KAI7901902.1 hypothetical protein BX663DRAFT_436684 [Cokeromyces recurvatus]